MRTRLTPFWFVLRFASLIVVSEPVAAQYPHDPPTSIPKIAEIAGVRVGYTTVDDMEKHSAPFRYMGWNIINFGEVVDMNGSAHGCPWGIWAQGVAVERPQIHSNRRQVVEFVQLQDRDTPVSQDTARPWWKWGWMGLIYPGMSQAQVLQAVKRKLPSPVMKDSTWTWTARGFARIGLHSYSDQRATAHYWTATLTFEKGQVAEIKVVCHPDG